jgi:hypothetical protein
MKQDGTHKDAKGIKNINSKLCEEQVHAIRTDTRTQQIIAKEYGVSQGVISKIKLRQNWSHLV